MASYCRSRTVRRRISPPRWPPQDTHIPCRIRRCRRTCRCRLCRIPVSSRRSRRHNLSRLPPRQHLASFPLLHYLYRLLRLCLRNQYRLLPRERRHPPPTRLGLTISLRHLAPQCRLLRQQRPQQEALTVPEDTVYDGRRTISRHRRTPSRSISRRICACQVALRAFSARPAPWDLLEAPAAAVVP